MNASLVGVFNRLGHVLIIVADILGLYRPRVLTNLTTGHVTWKSEQAVSSPSPIPDHISIVRNFARIRLTGEEQETLVEISPYLHSHLKVGGLVDLTYFHRPCNGEKCIAEINGMRV